MELSTEAYQQVKAEFYEMMKKEMDVAGEVELVADSYFVMMQSN